MRRGGIAVLLLVLVSAGVDRSPVIGASRTLEPLAGSLRSITIDDPGADSDGDVVFDDVTGTVVLTVPGANEIVVVPNSGAPVTIRNVSGLGDVTAAPDGVYGVSSDSLWRIDRSTNTLVTVKSGLATPKGLTRNGGQFVTTLDPAQGGLYRRIVAINPSSMAVTDIALPQYAGDFSQLLDNTPDGWLVGLPSRAQTRGLLFKYNYSASPAALDWFDTSRCAAMASGQGLVATAPENGRVALTAIGDLQPPVSYRWPVLSSTSTSCATGGGLLVIVGGIGDTFSGYNTTISYRSLGDPGAVLREWTIPQLAGHGQQVSVASDGRTVAHVGRYVNGPVMLTILPGAAVQGAPTAGNSATTPRNPAAQAPGASGTTRPAAPQSGSLDPFRELANPADWAIDTLTSRIYVASPFSRSIAVYSLSGQPLGTINDLASPSSVNVCGAGTYVTLFGSGQLAQITDHILTVVADGLSGVYSSTCSNGTLYVNKDATGSGQRGAVVRFDPATRLTTDIPGSFVDSTLAHWSTPTFLLTASFSVTARCALTGFTTCTLLTGTFREIETPFTLYAGGSKVVDLIGISYDATSMNPDGRSFGGYNTVISSATPALLAQRVDRFNQQILIKTTADPPVTVATITTAPSLRILDLQWIPGGRSLAILGSMNGLTKLIVVPDVLLSSPQPASDAGVIVEASQPPVPRQEGATSPSAVPSPERAPTTPDVFSKPAAPPTTTLPETALTPTATEVPPPRQTDTSSSASTTPLNPATSMVPTGARRPRTTVLTRSRTTASKPPAILRTTLRARPARQVP